LHPQGKATEMQVESLEQLQSLRALTEEMPTQELHRTQWIQMLVVFDQLRLTSVVKEMATTVLQMPATDVQQQWQLSQEGQEIMEMEQPTIPTRETRELKQQSRFVPEEQRHLEPLAHHKASRVLKAQTRVSVCVLVLLERLEV
jgi:hypothetical protein